jgi:hypothetical protein
MLAPNVDLRRVYVCTVYLFIQLGGGGGANQREGLRGNASQSRLKIPT